MSIMELLQAKYLQVLFQQNIPTKSTVKKCSLLNWYQ